MDKINHITIHCDCEFFAFMSYFSRANMPIWKEAFNCEFPNNVGVFTKKVVLFKNTHKMILIFWFCVVFYENLISLLHSTES